MESYKSSPDLASVAAETKAILPYLLLKRPDAPSSGLVFDGIKDLHGLHQHRCPKLSTRVTVVNADTIDAALELGPSAVDRKPVLVLNMANAQHGGGGWLKGALAQEEAICYRSSLSFTLKRDFYPLTDTEVIYSPSVLVVRKNMKSGHQLLDLNHPEYMPVISAVSAAAIRDPPLSRDSRGQMVYQKGHDRRSMKGKIKTILRIAAIHNHRRIVLGALGCGVFGNPNKEVAAIFREVLSETEFQGWFEKIVFAILGGDRPDGNHRVFKSCLEGMEV
jgi:uncharacterized protein (TIGR02452 family)